MKSPVAEKGGFRASGRVSKPRIPSPQRNTSPDHAPFRSSQCHGQSCAACRARGLKRDFGEVEHLQVSLKGPANFVTAADRKAEEVLREELAKARPGYGFIGEESGRHEGSDATHLWIVDPLDGTTNFLHGIPHFAISVALERESTIVAGLIYNPATDEMFLAERGKGAFLNDKRLRVAGRRRLADSVVSCGLPHLGRGDLELNRREMRGRQEKVAGLRRFGSAALDLAFIAAGRFDGYWERGLRPGIWPRVSCWCGRRAAMSQTCKARTPC